MPKRVHVSRLCGLLALVLFATTAWADTTVLVLSPAALGANDTTTWGQLGPDGTTIPNGAMATSTGGNTITVSFATAPSTGLTSVECPAAPSCSWNGGFSPGDTLIWAISNSSGSGTGTGSLDLSFATAVSGAGLALQADAPGTFNGTVQVEFTNSTFSAVYSVPSDAAGDPVFLGLLDTSGANIEAIDFNITGAAASASPNDFASDTLYSVNPTTGVTPEPVSFILFGTGMAAIGWKKFRQRAAHS